MNLASCCSEQMDVPESIDVIMNVMPPIVFWNMAVSVVFSVMVWAEIHHDGRIGLVRVNGSLNVQIYRDEILQHHVVPLINVTDGIFQHDNARPQTARVCRYFL